MRSLMLPVLVAALGVLASLPFRRDADQAALDREPSPALPDTVTPLRESLRPSTSRRITAQAHPFSDSERAHLNPYRLQIEGLPHSYDEVAVPLAISDQPVNVFEPLPEDPAHFDRFGIPRPHQPPQPPEMLASTEPSWKPLETLGQPPSALPGPSGEMLAASPPPSRSSNGDESAAASATPSTATKQGPFRVTSRILERSTTAPTAVVSEPPLPRAPLEPARTEAEKAAEELPVGELPPGEPPRRRFFIHEPT